MTTGYIILALVGLAANLCNKLFSALPRALAEVQLKADSSNWDKLSTNISKLVVIMVFMVSMAFSTSLVYFTYLHFFH